LIKQGFSLWLFLKSSDFGRIALDDLGLRHLAQCRCERDFAFDLDVELLRPAALRFQVKHQRLRVAFERLLHERLGNSTYGIASTLLINFHDFRVFPTHRVEVRLTDPKVCRDLADVQQPSQPPELVKLVVRQLAPCAEFFIRLLGHAGNLPNRIRFVIGIGTRHTLQLRKSI